VAKHQFLVFLNAAEKFLSKSLPIAQGNNLCRWFEKYFTQEKDASREQKFLIGKRFFCKHTSLHPDRINDAREEFR
jgi:hypothetical protein